MKALLLSLSVLFLGCAHSSPVQAACPYPSAWWAPVPPDQAKSWEILPQSVKCEDGEVILSKRTELGVFSNFAATPFVLDGYKYASIEGLWQGMKYPEDANDPRNDKRVKWEFTRAQVFAMVAEDAKHAGDKANDNMKKIGVTWVTYQGRKIDYKGLQAGVFYDIIFRASQAKMEQNPKVRELLTKTGNLEFKPDHDVNPLSLPAWKYFDIWMKLR